MQQRYLKDTGRTSDAGATLGILLPTPQARDHCNGSISSVADFPANLFQWLEPDAGRVMSVGCGTSFAKLSESSGPDTCWLKTSQDCSVQRMLLDDEGDCLEEWSETWPHWGTMLNGVCYRQRPLVRRISAKECSLLPTPQASEATHGGPNARDSNGTLHLSAVANLLPTPTRRDYKSGKGKTQEERGRTAGPSLSETSGGLLSPRFVEAIMGFPVGYTELTDSDA